MLFITANTQTTAKLNREPWFFAALIAEEMMVLLLNLWYAPCPRLVSHSRSLTPSPHYCLARTSLILAIIYMTFSQFGELFGEVHGFSEHQVGLSFLGLGLGMVLGTCTQPIWNG